MVKDDADKNCEGDACPRWLCRGIIIGNECCACSIKCCNMTDWLALSEEHYLSIFYNNVENNQKKPEKEAT